MTAAEARKLIPLSRKSPEVIDEAVSILNKEVENAAKFGYSSIETSIPLVSQNDKIDKKTQEGLQQLVGILIDRTNRVKKRLRDDGFVVSARPQLLGMLGGQFYIRW